jgi:TniQ
MTVYLPHLSDDQSVFSLVAQYGASLKVKDWPPFLRSLFGYDATFSPMLPYNLEYFAKQTESSLGLSGMELANSATTAPYLCALASEKQGAQIIAEVLRRRGGHKPTFLMKAVNRRRTLSFCPDCLLADQASGQGGYWRRRHQLPGSLFCDEHGGRLQEMPYQLGRADPWPVGPTRRTYDEVIPVAREHSDIWRLVAKASSALLRTETMVTRDAQALFDRDSQVLRLRNAGFGIGRTMVKPEPIRRSFIELFGESTLSALGMLPTPSGNWLVGRLSGRQTGLLPLAEVLLAVFCNAVSENSVHVWPNCVSRFAMHGPNHPVGERTSRGGKYFATCDCGASFSYARVENGEPQGVEMSVYGPEYECFARMLAESGETAAQIARDMGVAESNVRRWTRGDRNAVRVRYSADSKRFLLNEWRLLCVLVGSEGAACRINYSLWRLARLNKRDVIVRSSRVSMRRES